MESVSLTANYLAQKAQIQNRVTDANNNIGKLDQQIANLKIGGFLAGVAAIGTAGFALISGGAILGTISLASSAASFVLGVFQLANAWIESKFAHDMAKDEMGEVAAYLQAKETMENSVNSTTSRLEVLEEKCIEEINAGMLQDLGAGFIGVNKSLSLKYKGLMEQLYKAERKKSEVQQVLQELRNAVNETLTNISGVSSNATLTVLNIKEQDIKAKIDDMFSKLEVAADRWNQITDAERQAKKAEIQAIMMTISTIINAVIVAIQLKGAFSKEAKDVAKAKKSGDLTALNKATNAMNKVNNAMKLDAKALEALQIFVKWAFAHVEKNVMNNVQTERQGKVADLGITDTAKDSSVVNQASVNGFAGDLTDYAASQQAVYGQSELNNKKAEYALKSKEIDIDFHDNLYNVEQDLVGFGIDIVSDKLNALAAKMNYEAKLNERIRKDIEKQFEKELSEQNPSGSKELYHIIARAIIGSCKESAKEWAKESEAIRQLPNLTKSEAINEIKNKLSKADAAGQKLIMDQLYKAEDVLAKMPLTGNIYEEVQKPDDSQVVATPASVQGAKALESAQITGKKPDLTKADQAPVKQLASEVSIVPAGVKPLSSTQEMTPQAPEKTQAKSSDEMTQLWLDSLMSSGKELAKVGKQLDEVDNQLIDLKVKIDEAQTAEKPELEKQLRRLQEKLQATRKQLTSEKMRLASMKQKDVPEMQKALASQKEAVNKKREELLKNIKDVEDKMKAQEALAEKDPKNKKVIEQYKNLLKNKFEELINEGQDLAYTMVKYEVKVKVLEWDIAEHENFIKLLGTEVVELIKSIHDTQKMIGQKIVPAAGSVVNSEIRKYELKTAKK